MTFQRSTVLVVILCLAGCTTPGHFRSQALAEGMRQQLGTLLVQPDYDASKNITGYTKGKGSGAAKGAGNATAAMWQSMGSGGSGDGALLGFIFLLAATPVVAAGGAVYGAAVADSASDTQLYLAEIEGAADGARRIYERQLTEQFEALDLLPLAVSADVSVPHDSRLVVDFEQLVGIGDGSVKSNLAFGLRTHTQLYLGENPWPVYERSYFLHSPRQELSAWAENSGAALQASIDQLTTDTIAQIIDEYFYAEAYSVTPTYPAFRSAFRPKRLDTTEPEFSWQLYDGEQAVNDTSLSAVTYELQVTESDGRVYVMSNLIENQAKLEEPLPECSSFSWSVRATYDSFKQPRSTEWTKPQRFRTPCSG